MNRSLQILAVFMLLLLSSVVSAQTPLTCGIVAVEAPADVDAGVPIVFSAKLAGLNHTTNLAFKWKLSAGTITSGEGTSVITVDTAGLRGQEIIATAELFGAPIGCSVSASKTASVKAIGCGRGMKFDEYGDIKFEDEKARLDNFAIQLENDPQSVGYILASAGKETYQNEATERLARAKSYLVNVRKLDPNRVITLDCGFEQDLTLSLYAVPPGVQIPCNTWIEVPLSEVKYTKPRPKPAKKKR